MLSIQPPRALACIAFCVSLHPLWANGFLLVSSENSGQILEYDDTSGAFISVFANPGSPRQLLLGPGGLVNVVSAGGNDDIQYTQAGSLSGVFASAGMNIPTHQAFSPDGSLFVSNEVGNNVTRYDSSGNLIGAFSLSISNPAGIQYGADGDLYVASLNQGLVNKYDPATGAFISTFVTAHSGGLNSSQDIIFGPNGNLYVASFLSGQVIEYDRTTGSVVPGFSLSITTPRGLAFGPDGNLYVTDVVDNVVNRYDPITGASIGNFVASGNGLDGPASLVFVTLPEPGTILAGALGALLVLAHRIRRR